MKPEQDQKTDPIGLYPKSEGQDIGEQKYVFSFDEYIEELASIISNQPDPFSPAGAPLNDWIRAVAQDPGIRRIHALLSAKDENGEDTSYDLCLDRPDLPENVSAPSDPGARLTIIALNIAILKHIAGRQGLLPREQADEQIALLSTLKDQILSGNIDGDKSIEADLVSSNRKYLVPALLTLMAALLAACANESARAAPLHTETNSAPTPTRVAHLPTEDAPTPRASATPSAPTSTPTSAVSPTAPATSTQAATATSEATATTETRPEYHAGVPETLDECKQNVIRYDHYEDDIKRYNTAISDFMDANPNYVPAWNLLGHSGFTPGPYTPYIETGFLVVGFDQPTEGQPLIVSCGHMVTPNGDQIFIFSAPFTGVDGETHILNFGMSELAAREVARTKPDLFEANLALKVIFPELRGELLEPDRIDLLVGRGEPAYPEIGNFAGFYELQGVANRYGYEALINKLLSGQPLTVEEYSQLENLIVPAINIRTRNDH